MKEKRNKKEQKKEIMKRNKTKIKWKGKKLY
jgi:hypothetical protein